MIIVSMTFFLINQTRMIMDPAMISQMYQILKYKTVILRVLASLYVCVHT